MDVAVEHGGAEAEVRTAVRVQQIAVMTEPRLLRQIAQVGARNPPGVVECVIDVSGDLEGAHRLRAGGREVAAGAEARQHLRQRRPRAVDQIRRDTVIRKGASVAVRVSVEGVVDRPAALRKIARGLAGPGNGDRRIRYRIVGIAFRRRPEKSAALGDRASERAAGQIVRHFFEILLADDAGVEVLLLEIRQLAPERVQLARTELIQGAPRPFVRAAAVNRIEHAAARTAHLGVVGVRLHLHFLNRLEDGDDHRAVAHIGHGDAVHGVVVAAKRAAAKREQGRVRLVRLLHPDRVAGMHHVGRVHGHDENVAPGSGQHFDLSAVDRGRNGRRPVLHQRSLARNRYDLIDGADLQSGVHHEKSGDAHEQIFAYETVEACRLGAQRVRSGLQIGERVLTGRIGFRAPAAAGFFVPQRNRGSGMKAPSASRILPRIPPWKVCAKAPGKLYRTPAMKTLAARNPIASFLY